MKKMIFLFVISVIPQLLTAANINHYPDSPLLPGTRVIAGDPHQNEFFIVADKDLPLIEKEIKSSKAEKLVDAKSNAKTKPTNVAKIVDKIRIALKEAKANKQRKLPQGKTVTNPIASKHKAKVRINHRLSQQKTRKTIAQRPLTTTAKLRRHHQVKVASLKANVRDIKLKREVSEEAGRH